MRLMVKLSVLPMLMTLLMTWQHSAIAKPKVNPTDYLQKVADTMISAIDKNKGNLKNNPQLAEKLIREYLLPHIDQDAFSKKVLQSKLWKDLSSGQQQQFKQAFVNQVISKYAKGLELYDGQSFTFDKARISSKGNALVSSKMKSSSSENLTISYYLSPDNDSWKITNIVVDGIDMAKSYRNQFLPRINEVGMEKFLQELKSPAKN